MERQSSLGKGITNIFGKKDFRDEHGQLYSRVYTDDKYNTMGTNLPINTLSHGYDETLQDRNKSFGAGQDIFRRNHPSQMPDNQDAGRQSQQFPSFRGSVLNQGPTQKSVFKPNNSNIFRKSFNKRGLSDMPQDFRPLTSGLNNAYTPKSKASQFGIGQEEQSTSKPRFNQTAVRNPTMTRQALVNQAHSLGKQQTIFKQANSFVSPSFKVRREDLISKIDGLGPGPGPDQIEVDGHRLTTGQFQAAQNAVTARLQEQFTLSDDMSLNDLNLQIQDARNQQLSANYSPLAYFPTQSILIPKQIHEIAGDQKDWKVEMSKRNKLIYFGIGNRLVVWDYDQQMNQGIVRSLQNNNNRQRLQARDLQSKLVVIGLLNFSQEITCIKELTSRNLTTGWQACNFAVHGCLSVLVATASEIKLIHVQKAENRQSISVQESLIQPLVVQISAPVTTMVELEKTGRVFYNGINGNVCEILFKDYKNTFSGLLFMNSYDKRKLESQNHQQENFVAKMIPYMLKLDYYKAVEEIKIDEQRNMLYCLGSVIGGRGDGQSVIEVFTLGDVADQCRQLTTIYLWQIFEQLVDYMQFEQEIYDKYKQAKYYQIRTIEPITFAQSRQHHLMIVTQEGTRIFLKFQDVQATTNLFKTDIEKLGLQSDLIMETHLTRDWQISAVITNFPSDKELFNETEAKEISATFFGGHPMKNADYMHMKRPIVDFVHSDCQANSLMYVLHSDQSDPDWLKLCFIKKNDAQYAYMRKEFDQFQGQNLQGSIRQDFSVIMIGETRQQDNFDLSNKRLQMNNEHVVKVQSVTPQIDSSLLVTLGIEQPLEQPLYGRKNLIRHYYPSNDLERQVFIKGQQYHVLTSNRLIQLSSQMPIDKLVMILLELQRMRNSNEQADLLIHFQDFANKYGQSETCAMLIQIISDNSAFYNIFSRINCVFQLNAKELMQQEIDPRYQQLGVSRQSTQRANSISYQRSRTGLQASQSHNRSIMNMASMTRRSKFRREHDNQENISNLMEFNLNEPDQFEAIQLQNDVKKRAFELLTSYGDSVNIKQEEELQNLDSNFLNDIKNSKVEQESNLLFIYSSKHQGLYLYLYRLLQPIWDTEITSQRQNLDLTAQICNVNIFLPVRSKLENLYEFIVQNTRNLQGRVYQKAELFNEEERQFLGIISLQRLNQSMQDYVEQAEKQSCIELKAFLKRCLGVIDFLKLTAPCQEEFNKILHGLDENMKDNLSKISFKDLVNSNSNPLVRKMVELANRVTNNHDPNRTVDEIRLRAQQTQYLCQTLFSPGENQIFIGESCLSNALNERDIEKKEKLMKEAMSSFKQNPLKVDIKAIMSSLAQNGNFVLIIDLIIAQIQRLDKDKDINKIEELLDIIVTIFNMLDKVIVDKTNAQELVKRQRVDPDYDGQHAMIFLKELVRVQDQGIHINVRRKLVQLICEHKQWQIIGYIIHFFLRRDQDVDYIMEVLDVEMLKKHCDSFINEQSKANRLTKAQFFIVKRILEKSNQTESLASLVVQVVTDQINLQRREADEWFEDPLTCEKRLEIVQWTDQLLKDAKKRFANGQKNLSQLEPRMNGQTGQLVEQQISLEKELENCKFILKEQFEAIKSAKKLLKILQDKAAHQQQALDEQQRLDNLGTFITQMDERLLSIKNLTSKYYDFDIADRKAYILIHKTDQSMDRQAQEKVRARKLEAIKHLVKVTHENYPSKETFQQAVLEQVKMLFETSALNESLTSSLLLYANQVRLFDPVSIDSIRSGNPWWLTEIIFGKMSIEPSKFISHIATSQPDNLSKHGAILACFREWSRLVSMGNYQVSQQAQAIALNDLKRHGPSLFKEVLLDHSSQWLNENQLKLSKQEFSQISELLKLVKEEFDQLLHRHIVGYQQIRQQMQPKPQEQRPQQQKKEQVERKPLHAEQLQRPQDEEQRHRQVQRRNQSGRSFTPSRAIVRADQRQDQDENQLMLDDIKHEERDDPPRVSLTQMKRQMMESQNNQK